MTTRILLFLFLLQQGALSACKESRQTKQLKTETQARPTPPLAPPREALVPSSLTIQTISAAESTYGYNILQNGKVFIHQPHLPGLPGLRGFDTEADARTAAALVLDKIRQHIMPPTVSPQELDSLGVLPAHVRAK